MLTTHLYDGTLQDGQTTLAAGKEAAEPKACFSWALLGLAGAFEGLAQDFYRYGATTPNTLAAALFLGMDMMETGEPVNPELEMLTYPALRTVLGDFRDDIAAAQVGFECGDAGGADFVVLVDMFKARLDFNGDGQADDVETLGPFWRRSLAHLAPTPTWMTRPAPSACGRYLTPISALTPPTPSSLPAIARSSRPISTCCWLMISRLSMMPICTGCFRGPVCRCRIMPRAAP